jgi:feruloyl esterase
MVKWVENGIAPDTLQASRALGNGAVRTRPLCAYPRTAQWTGKGSTDDAANFICVDGKHDLKDFTISSTN